MSVENINFEKITTSDPSLNNDISPLALTDLFEQTNNVKFGNKVVLEQLKAETQLQNNLRVFSIEKISNVMLNNSSLEYEKVADFHDLYFKYLKNTNKWPALHEAVFQNDLHAVKIFLENGLDPNYIYSKDGKESWLDALCMAVVIGNLDMINLILIFSPKIRWNHVRMVINGRIEWIIANYSSSKDSKEFVTIPNKNKIEILNCILNYQGDFPEKNEINQSGQPNAWGCIYGALGQKDFSLAEFLIDKGCTCNSRREINNYHLVSIAIQNGASLSTIIKILDAGGGICNDTCKRGNTVYQAVSLNRDDLIELLIQRGVDLSPIIPGYWMYVFEKALENENLNMVKLFLDNGASINRFSLAQPINPLLLSIKTKNVRFVEFLLEYGADPNFTYHNEYQYNPLKFASEIGNEDIIKLLIKHDAVLH
ncbi:MAG: hypothetical protein K940chlam8_00330 [Chlamydiae bacterium]|nr:hypothetical protein [Chlamydiota bacterium]